MKFLTTFFILFLCSNFFAQLTNEQTLQLKQEVLAKINALRTEKKLGVLKYNNVLQAASLFHSDYMATNQVLRHEEKNPKSGTPKSRVINAGGKDFEWIGENIYQSTPQSFPLTKEAVSKLAVQMFEAWKKSPPHYANMTNKNFDLADFGFAVDPKTNVVYATNLFGKKGTIINNQLSNNAFGLVMGPATCKDEFKGYYNLMYNLGNGLCTQNGEVFLRVSNIESIKKLITNENDGIAIDIVERSQYPCGSSNKLDMSPVYDGVLLKPVYKKELFEQNEAQSDYRFVVNLGAIPAALLSKQLEFHIVFIKSGKVCTIINTGEVDEDRYHLTPVEPKIVKPENVKMRNSGIIQSEELVFDFSPKDSIPKSIPSLKSNSYKVHSVYIQSYSSIDGDSLSNAYYHYMRGKWIERYVGSKLNIQPHQMHKDYKENWPMMEFQMRYYFADELAKLSHDSIRFMYKDYVDIPWKKLFAAQRKSTVTINYLSTLPPDAKPIDLAKMNLSTALINKDWDLANKCLAIYFENKVFPDLILLNPFFEIIKGEPALAQNIAAIYYQHSIYNLESETQFLFAALQHGDKLTFEAKENLALLYAKLSYDLLGIWDLPSQQLANVIKPENVLKVIKGLNFRPEVMINVHLTFIDYYGQINDSKNIKISFEFIEHYYKDKVVNLEDKIKLCLFFNRWSRYDLTIELLLPLFNENKLTEYGTFLLAKTMVFYPEGNKDEAKKVLLASSSYKKAWCNWLNKEFTLLEDEEVKKQFCKICK